MKFIILLFLSLNFAFSQSELKRGVYKSQIPITADISLGKVLGKISYSFVFSVIENDSYIKELRIKSNLNKSETSKMYENKLMNYFEESLSYSELHSYSGLDSRAEISNIRTEDRGKWFLDRVIGKKAVRINAVDGDFSETKALDLIFNNLRDRDGDSKKEVHARLAMRENFEDNTIDIFYVNDDGEEILLKDISLKIKANWRLQLRFSISGNNDSIVIY